jgi:hypothetical protein
MSLVTGRQLVRCAAVTTAISATVLLSSFGVALAYGPPPPPGQPVPGEYNCIITSRTVGPFGATIGPLWIGAIRALLEIRPHTFPLPVQVTITAPYSPIGACQGGPLADPDGYRVIGGVGVLVTRSNVPFGPFPRPLFLQIAASHIRGFRSLEIAALGGNGGLTVVARSQTQWPITVAVGTSTDYVVFAAAGWLPGSRHQTASARRQGDMAMPAAELLSASLLPTGSAVPGLGVVLLSIQSGRGSRLGPGGRS